VPQLVYSFDVTIPPGTPQSANYSVSCAFPAAVVSKITIKVPPGPRGNMGFAIGGSGTAVLPYGAGQFIVTDNEDISWDVTDQMDSGAWEVFGYNNGNQPHTIYVRFLCDPADGASSTAIADPIASSALVG
jgi:hypothetical protein